MVHDGSRWFTILKHRNKMVQKVHIKKSDTQNETIFEPQSNPSSSNSLPDLHNFKHNVRQAWYPHEFVALMGVDPIDAGTGAAASGVHVSRRRRQHGTEGPPATGRCMRVGVLLPAFFKHSRTAEASTVFALQSSGDCCDTKHRWT